MAVLGRVVPTVVLALALNGCGLESSRERDAVHESTGVSAAVPPDVATAPTVVPGDAITVTPEETYQASLFLLDVSRRGLREIVLPFRPIWFEQPSVVWSPDGTEVAVVDTYSDFTALYDATTGAQRAATTVTEAPTWTSRVVPGVSVAISDTGNDGTAESPDGTMTATAARYDGFNTEIQIRHHVDNALATAPAQAPFAWSPDSNVIAASNGWGVALINPRDGAHRTVVRGSVAEGSYWIGPMAWAPDGITLAFTGWAEEPTG